MRGGQEIAHDTRGRAGIDEIVDDKHAGTAREYLRRDALQHLDLALRLVAIARNRDRLDDADAELARDDRRRHEPAAGDRDDRVERPGTREPPGKRARIAVKLVPGHGKNFFGGLARRKFRRRVHGVLRSRESRSTSARVSAIAAASTVSSFERSTIELRKRPSAKDGYEPIETPLCRSAMSLRSAA